MTIKAWRLALSGLLTLLMIVLTACGGEKTPTPTGNPAAVASATTSVSIPSVNSGAPAGGTNQPAPQPGTSPTGNESTVGGIQAFPAGEVKPVEIITADNVTLTGTFYVAPKAGSPAVAMLHMAGGQRGDWDTLARQLQAAGFSVLTLDLRGHGGSQLDRFGHDVHAGTPGAAWAVAQSRKARVRSPGRSGSGPGRCRPAGRPGRSQRLRR